MDLSHPYTSVSPTLDPAVLVALMGTTRPLTGREVARLLGRASHSGVIAVLERLVEQGLVDREEAGRAFLFTLNREHLAAPAVAVLANLREELLNRLQETAGSWRIKAHHLSLFGSAARGDGGTESDIDLFVVRHTAVEAQKPAWREQLDLLAWKVERWTGNPASIIEVDQRDIARLRKQRPSVVDQLLTDAISLIGPDVATLLRAA